MSAITRGSFWNTVSRLNKNKRLKFWLTSLVIAMGPVLAIATFAIFGPLEIGSSVLGLRLVLMADLVYVLIIATLVMQRVARIVAARRARSAGSRLHLRLTGVFAIVALIPTVLVAVFAGLTINIGLEGWFSDRVSNVIGTSLAAAQAYETEHRDAIMRDAVLLTTRLNSLNAQYGGVIDDGQLRQFLGDIPTFLQDNLTEIFIVDGAGNIRVRGDGSYLFDFEKPEVTQIEDARTSGYLLIEDPDRNEYRALMPLVAYLDHYIYVTRQVDGDLLSLLDDTQETATLYQQLENQRGRMVFDFGLFYLGFAVTLILVSIWLGLWFAERLSRPVGRLAGAAQQVGMGDLSVQVREERGDDEIAMLGRYFNQMTRQLKAQRETLLDNTQQIEQRRRLFDSVLSSVTSGVVGLDASGVVTFVNKSAERLLDMEAADTRPISLAVPEFAALYERLRESKSEVVQEEIQVTRNGKTETLLVRLALRRHEDGALDGYVVAFEDVTDLVSAQRMAAWGDVARRIAHEIKNPLTPIQLSAERIKRKFRAEVTSADDLDQMTDVIVRQTNDLRRIVDEFSKFARMPEPAKKSEDVTALVQAAVLLQGSAQNLTLKSDIPATAVFANVDATMISQALTNIIKNAGEAIEGYVEKNGPDGFDPEIRVSMESTDDEITITVADNGIGLPKDRSRLFEPYVTTRDKGTGLGLPIVKKIIEEHGGSLQLSDAPVFDGNNHVGALVEIHLPRTVQTETLTIEETV